MCKKRLDLKERLPYGMEAYLETHGWHFSKKMCQQAVARMTSRGGNDQVQFQGKETVDETLRRYGVDAGRYTGYDAVFVYHMAIADFLGSSIQDERALALYVKDYLEDPDGYDEVAFTRYYADCIGKGEMPEWEDVL